MNYPARILFQTLVKPFYKENAVVFVLIFTGMFYAVGSVDGAGLFAFHYSLALGMLKSNIFLLLVFTTWLFYIRKCVVFVSSVLRDPHYTFLHIYNYLSSFKRFQLFFFVHVGLLMPVFLYLLFIAFVGWHEHLYVQTMSSIIYVLIACISMAIWNVYALGNPGKKTIYPVFRLLRNFSAASSYPFILIRFIAVTKKFTWIVVKVVTCVPLYLIARNNTLTCSDIILLFLFFNFGILTNGIFVCKTREFEETYLSFYRGLPVSLLKRFLQYTLVYFIVLIPEFITLIILTPFHLHYFYATSFFLCSFSLLLLLNSISFLHDFNINGYLGIFSLVLLLQYIFIIAVGFSFLYLLFFISAISLFIAGYYKYERNI